MPQTGQVQMPLVLFDNDPDFRIGFAWGEAMLRDGAYVYPWHTVFLCAAMTEGDIELAVAAADRAFAAVSAAEEVRPHALLMETFGALH